MKNLKFVVGLLLFVGLLVISGSATMAQQLPIEDVVVPTLSGLRDPAAQSLIIVLPADATPTPQPGNTRGGATFQRGVNNLTIATPGAPVLDSVGMTCSEDNDGDGDTDSCSCPSNDSACMGDLIAWCSADGDYLTGDTHTTSCIAGGTPNSGGNSDD